MAGPRRGGSAAAKKVTGKRKRTKTSDDEAEDAREAANFRENDVADRRAAYITERTLFPDNAEQGIYLCRGDAVACKDNNSFIAGYAGCETLAEFQALMDTVGPIIRASAKQMVEIRARDRNALEARHPMMKASMVIQMARSAASPILTEDITSEEEPDIDIFPKDEKSCARLHLALLRCVHQMLSTTAERKQQGRLTADMNIGTPLPDFPDFTGIKVRDDWFPTAEDVNRALFVRAAYLRKMDKNPARKAKADAAPRETLGPFQMKKAPVIPIYIHPDQVNMNTAAQDAAQQRAFRSLVDGISANDLFADLARADRSTVSGEESLLTMDHAFQKCKVSVTAGLDTWTEEERIRHLRLLVGQVEFMFDKTTQILPGPGLPTDDRLTAKVRDEAERGAEHLELDEYDLVEKYRSMQRTLNGRSSCKGPSLKSAFDFLQLKKAPCAPTLQNEEMDFQILFRGLPLKYWQPTAIAWLTSMCHSVFGGGILGDDVGLGKTVEALCTVVATSEQIENRRRKWEIEKTAIEENEDLAESEKEAEMEALGEEPVHRPVLIVGPSCALTPWLHDTQRFFTTAPGSPDAGRNINMYAWSGQSSQRSNETVELGMSYTSVKRSFGGLKRAIRPLNQRDPQTSRTVFLVGLQSLQGCVLHKEGDEATPKEDPKADPKGKGKAKETQDGNESEEEPEANDPEDDNEPPKRKKKGVTNSLNGVARPHADIFRGIIIDEAHRVKDPNALQTDACFLMQPDWYILISGTPMKNGPHDLYGLLRFPWKSVERHRVAAGGSAIQGQALEHKDYGTYYRSLVTELDKDILRADERTQMDFARFLDPDMYQKFVPALASSESALASIDKVTPLPATMMILRRLKGDIVQVDEVQKIIGSSIPPWECVHVELRMCPVTAAYYNGASDLIWRTSQAPAQSVPSSNPQDDEFMKTDPRMRSLRHAAANPYLVYFIKRIADSSAKVVNRAIAGKMSKFELYHTWTKSDLHGLAPTTRLGMLNYITGSSAKHQAMIKYILDWIIEEKQKVIFWAHEPLTFMLADLVLELAQVHHVAIYSNITFDKRSTAESRFNNDDTIRACLMSSRSATESANLQKGGCRAVILDVIPLTTTLQCGGRQARIGQLHRQLIHVLTLDESIDQYATHNICRAFLAQVVATAEVPSALCKAYKDLLTSDDTVNLTTEATSTGQSFDDMIRSRVTVLHADYLLRHMFGFRTSRLGDPWKNKTDVHAKNKIPEEILFRLAYGGPVARECVAQLDKEQEHKQAQKEKKHKVLASERNKYNVSAIHDMGTPFALPLIYRPDAPPINDPDRVALIALKQAETLAKTTEYRILRMSAVDILQSFAAKAAEPSQYMTLAIAGAKNRAATTTIPGIYSNLSGPLSTQEEDLVSPTPNRSKADRRSKGTAEGAPGTGPVSRRDSTRQVSTSKTVDKDTEMIDRPSTPVKEPGLGSESGPPFRSDTTDKESSDEKSEKTDDDEGEKTDDDEGEKTDDDEGEKTDDDEGEKTDNEETQQAADGKDKDGDVGMGDGDDGEGIGPWLGYDSLEAQGYMDTLQYRCRKGDFLALLSSTDVGRNELAGFQVKDRTALVCGRIYGVLRESQPQLAWDLARRYDDHIRANEMTPLATPRAKDKEDSKGKKT